MSLRDIIEIDLQEVIFSTDDFAETVIYTPFGGSPKEVTVVFIPGRDIDDARWNAAVQASAVMWVQASDVASPAYKDTVTVGTDTWTIVNINRRGRDKIWRLDLRRDLRPTFKK